MYDEGLRSTVSGNRWPVEDSRTKRYSAFCHYAAYNATCPQSNGKRLGQVRCRDSSGAITPCVAEIAGWEVSSNHFNHAFQTATCADWHL